MKKLLIVSLLFLPTLEAPAFSQLPFASPHVNNNIKIYKQHPDWIKVHCSGMRMWNRRGESAFSDKAFFYNAQTDSAVARHPQKDWLQFNVYISSNYCPDIW